VAAAQKSRNRRALDLSIASISAPAFHDDAPDDDPEAHADLRRQHQILPSGASGDFTAITEQANPACAPNTARIEPVIEKLRL